MLDELKASTKPCLPKLKVDGTQGTTPDIGL